MFVRTTWTCLIVALWTAAPLACAEEQPLDAKDPLPRLAAALESEPVALVGLRDIRALNDKYAKTVLSAMLADSSYERGAAALDRAMAQIFGTTPRAFVELHEKNLTGPLLLALVPVEAQAPAKKPIAGEPVDLRSAVLKLVVVAQVPAVDSGTALMQEWPKGDNAFGALAAATVKTIPTADLVPPEKVPAWAAALPWPEGDVVVRVQAQAVTAAARQAAQESKMLVEGYFMDVPAFAKLIEGSGIRALTYSVSFDKPQIYERLVADLDGQNSNFKSLMQAAREKPGSWEPLMSATSADVDATIMVQSDVNALAADLPFLMQGLERYVRGRRWAKLNGETPDALDPRRFKFLTDRLQGSFALSAHPAITGDLRLNVAAALKGTDVEAVRKEFLAGLAKVGEPFETLFNARKIGGAAPLGSVQQTKSKFGSPLIGLTAGWCWLCSSTAAYQELTDAFRLSHTHAGIEQRRAVLAKKAENPPPATEPSTTASKKPPLPPRPEQPLPPPPGIEWTDTDCARVEVGLDRVMKIGYTAWRLTTTEQPSLAGVKIPDELLPSPALFARPLGMLRAGLCRNEQRIELRSNCVIPGATIALLALLHDAADTLATARQYAKDATARNETKAEQDVTPPEGEPAAKKGGDGKPVKPGKEPAAPTPPPPTPGPTSGEAK